MRYRTRLVLLVTGLLAGAVIVISALLAWSTRDALLASAEDSGRMVANLLARSAGLANEIPNEVEDMLGAQMVAEARILAHFVDAAEKAGFTPDDINRRLRQLANTTVLNEFWITDEKGHAYLRNIDVDFTFSPSALEQPQAHVFWPLLTVKDHVVQEARQREIDGQHFKYAGVAGVDRPRIVEVGFNARYLNDLKARVGLSRAVQALLTGGDIEAIWVFDTKLGQLAGPEVMGPASARFPSEKEMQSIRDALKDHLTRSVLQGDALSVIAPIKTDAEGVIGAALVRIPTEHMWQAVGNQLRTAAIIAFAVLGAGLVLSYLLAKRQLAPIEALTAAATSVEERTFDPRCLDEITDRPDELGRLARVFAGMGQTVLAREEKLDTLVQERTKALAERTEQLETLSTKLSKYLSPQVYASIFQGRQQVEIASSRKKLTIFFSDLVGFTETTENLESEELTSILNRYLDEMASIALKYGATLDKYVGDAIIAFFGDPETRGVAEDAKACVAMAIEMRQRIAELEREWQDAGLERPFCARMGINTGFCTVGNFGSQDRMDYTIIGGAVNVAARLESAARPGEILMAHETWSLVKDVVIANEVAPLTVKGLSQPLHVHEVQGLCESTPPKVLHRNIDGMRITIELGDGNRQRTVRALEALIGEIDDGRTEI
jgi:class 3 adenylate cyclase/HAMP domain-containing protein